MEIKGTSVRISIRICDPTLALSSVEMVTCGPNSFGLIIEDKCHDKRPTCEIVHAPPLSYTAFIFGGQWYDGV